MFFLSFCAAVCLSHTSTEKKTVSERRLDAGCADKLEHERGCLFEAFRVFQRIHASDVFSSSVSCMTGLYRPSLVISLMQQSPVRPDPLSLSNICQPACWRWKPAAVCGDCSSTQKAGREI